MKPIMPPFAISLLLHTYAIATPYSESGISESCGAFTQWMAFFRTNDMIVRDNESPCGYKITPRGEAHVKHLTQLQLPVQRWELPQ